MLRVAFQHERWRILLYRRLLSTTRSPYQVLGVPSGATKADVKKAYIEKAKKCHPDLFPDDEEKTKEFQLQEAYSILSDTKKRAEYAQMQRATQGHGPAGPRHPYTDYSGTYSRNSGAYGHSFRHGADGRGKKDPLHDMLQEMLRAQQQKHQKYGPEYAREAKIRGSRWDQIILRLVLAYMVLWIFFGNLRLETNERKRRISELETDIKIQNDTMKMLMKYGYYSPKTPKLETLDIKNQKLSSKDQSSEPESTEKV